MKGFNVCYTGVTHTLQAPTEYGEIFWQWWGLQSQAEEKEENQKTLQDTIQVGKSDARQNCWYAYMYKNRIYTQGSQGPYTFTGAYKYLQIEFAK